MVGGVKYHWLQRKRQFASAAKFQNSIFSSLEMPPPAECPPGRMPSFTPSSRRHWHDYMSVDVCGAWQRVLEAATVRTVPVTASVEVTPCATQWVASVSVGWASVVTSATYRATDFTSDLAVPSRVTVCTGPPATRSLAAATAPVAGMDNTANSVCVNSEYYCCVKPFNSANFRVRVHGGQLCESLFTTSKCW